VKKSLLISAASLLIVATSSVTYALPLDDFNDNSMNISLWSLYQDNPNNGWLDETNGRLEIHSKAVDDNAAAVYLANGWGFSTTNSFSFKTDFYCSLPSGPEYHEFNISLGLLRIPITMSANEVDITTGSYVEEYGTEAYFTCNKNTDGNYVDEGHKTRIQDGGILYISYDANKDELYLSDAGYWAANAWVTIPGLLKGEWGGAFVKPYLGGGYVYNIALDSGDAYFDNFIVDSGTIVQICEYVLSGDLNNDCRVDFLDFAIMASNWLTDCTTDPSNPQCLLK
jgi:hypothetical protein